MNDAASSIPSGPLPPETQPSPAAIAPPAPPAERRLRLWPGVVIVVLYWLILNVPGWVAPGDMASFMIPFFGSMVVAALFPLWWLFASRLRWRDRLLGLLAFLGIGTVAFLAFHPTMRELGPFSLTFYVFPVVMTGWVLWLLVTPFLRWPVRVAGLVVVLLLTWGYFTTLRFEGTDGTFTAAFPFRWVPTAEERFLAEVAAGKLKGAPTADAPTAEPLVLQPGDWPGFRGPDRDGRRTGARLATDWQLYPPRQVWRHRVGPGWSSFAVVGNRLYTQEQRGEEEAVVCYDAGSGAERWAHRDSARFSEAIGGPGPRATPTFHEGKIYALGAAGRLNCLDAATGKSLWSHDITADSGATVPQWGFASSPLVAQGVVTVFAGGPEGKSVLGYNALSGELAWSAGEGKFSYCSPHLVRMGGVEQLVIATEVGLTAFDPARGKVLWQHDWPLDGDMARVVQPTRVGDSDLLVGTGFGKGTRRVHVGREGEGWTTQEKWTTRAINPYYNDLVVHGGHAYGFDNNFFTCIDLENGKSKWRARGYGNGQVLLLADQDLLLVLSEKGEAALVEASPDGHKELGRFQAIEGKTWNHPVVAHGKLFVRNGEEAACYELVELESGGRGKAGE